MQLEIASTILVVATLLTELTHILCSKAPEGISLAQSLKSNAIWLRDKPNRRKSRDKEIPELVGGLGEVLRRPKRL